MLPFVLIAGFLIVRKLQRTDLVTSFLTVFLVFSLGKNIFDWQHIFLSVKNIFAYSPVLFFSFVMLTEPMTTPPVKKLRIIYGVLVAFLLAPFAHIYSFYFSPEFALLIGNIFSYAISPKQKLLLKLKEKNIIANNTIQFAFDLQTKLKFLPGQYLEWTLSHQKQDQRGMRRYFTIASSPTEEDIKLCVKFYELASSYKKRLKNLPIGSDIVASQLAGEFTMPNDKNKKLVFIAGGIGITPFRSMIKYLIDINEKRDIIIFYTNNSFSDIVYKEIFKEAEKKLGIKTVYILNHLHGVPIDFNCNVGLITKEVIIEKAPDYQERTYYISGPRSMIVSFEKTLNEIGITKSNIKTDFFPGFA
jgi:ferredoxin-NADP reductase